jgi:hypothetical protein
MQRPMPWPSFNFSCYQVGRQSQQQWLAVDVPHGIICIHSLVDYLSAVVGLDCNKEKMTWVYYLQYVLEQIMLKSPVLAVGDLGLHQLLYGSVIHIPLTLLPKDIEQYILSVTASSVIQNKLKQFQLYGGWSLPQQWPPPAPCIVLYLMIHPVNGYGVLASCIRKKT